MYIQCFITKADGSPVFVDYEGVRYIFQKNEWGDSVCFVGNQAHQRRLLKMGTANYREYDAPDEAVGGGTLGAAPIPLGGRQKRPDEKPPEESPGPLAETVEADHRPLKQLTAEEGAQDAANRTAVSEPEQAQDQAQEPEPIEVDWAPSAIKSKIKEFRTLTDVNFISFLTNNRDRIMNWPVVVRTEIAKKIRNKLPAYDPEAEGIEGFILDDYLGGRNTSDS